ncbi:hypothetical protein Taro_020847 [Colocasia esculenta]|uniref:Uncharacterized protein n=1 Tax=Colocasia esculenta TaxID=4460 RepID=A0A843UZU3_COLES|nr:hypothetical protein [Colocasia esculenta]
MFKGRVEELLVAEELWNDHKKPFFFPFSSAATCTNHPLEVNQKRVKPKPNLARPIPLEIGILITLSHNCNGSQPVASYARHTRVLVYILDGYFLGVHWCLRT